MTTTQRRLYLLAFVILFLFTAPVIVLFAQGYRFDRVNNIFVHSGSVTVKSWPRGIDIFVDGKKKKKSALNVINGSYTVNGVRPGKHEIVCKKDGYTSWKKNVDVHSGISTEFWNVLLFPTENTEIQTLPSQDVQQFFLSPRSDTEVVLFSEEDDKRVVSLLDTEDNSLKKIYETSELHFLDQNEKENVEWSSDNEQILLPFVSDTGERTFVIAKIDKESLEDIIVLNDLFNLELNSQDKELKESGNKSGISKDADDQISDFSASETSSSNKKTLPTSPKNSDPVVSNKITQISEEEREEETLVEDRIKQVRWMFNKNDELVVLTEKHALYYIDIKNPEEKLLLDENVGGFDFAGNRIYYFHLTDTSIWELKNNDIKTKRQIASLLTITDKDSFVKMITYDQYRIAMITPDNKLFLFNYEKEEGEISIKELSGDVQDVQFSDDGKKLLYWSNNEIWYVILRDWEVQPVREKGDRFLITRSSSPIKNVQWIEDYENIIFTTDSTIKSSGIDTRDRVEIINIKENEVGLANRDVLYDKNTQLLYTKKSLGEKKYSFETLRLIDRGGFLGL